MSASTFLGVGDGFGLIWKRKMHIKPKGFEKKRKRIRHLKIYILMEIS
jgi:hypothetical protein